MFNSGQSCCAVEVRFSNGMPISLLMPTLAHLRTRINFRLVCVQFYRDRKGKLIVNLARATCSLSSRKNYKLGDPTSADTNLGPVVSLASAERIRKQVADAGQWHPSYKTAVLNLKLHRISQGRRESFDIR